MESITEVRAKLTLHPTEVGSRISHFKNLNFDWDVYLPTRGKNLQRDFVWSLEQKRNIIWSLLINRHIPHLAMINIINPDNKKEDIYQVIDGKQRLSSIFEFMDDKFTIEVDGKEYVFSELPEDYQRAISHYHIRYYLVNEEFSQAVTDEQKITWFKFINFAGTEQDEEHLNGL